MAKKNDTSKEDDIQIICRNKRATYEYNIFDTLECGIVLTGTEVKSLRESSVSLEDAYARIGDDEVWLIGSDIPEYSMGNRFNHKPKRPRKLLLHRREIAKFAGKASQQGFTLIPLRLVFQKRPGQGRNSRGPRQEAVRQARVPEDGRGPARDSPGHDAAGTGMNQPAVQARNSLACAAGSGVSIRRAMTPRGRE